VKKVVFLGLIASYGLLIQKTKVKEPAMQYSFTMATIMEKLNKKYNSI
jgi:hypothetical protein